MYTRYIVSCIRCLAASAAAAAACKMRCDFRFSKMASFNAFPLTLHAHFRFVWLY